MRAALIATSLVLLVCGGAVALLAIFGSDVKTFRYATYEEAVTGDLFAGGWLPEFVPASARDIVMHNNASMNTSTGEFRYDADDTSAFVAWLRPIEADHSNTDDYAARAADMVSRGYSAYEFCDDGLFWVFFLDAGDRHVEYEMWPVLACPSGRGSTGTR